MIDEEWLDRTLRAKFPSGEQLQGVAGVGGYSVAIKYKDAEGKLWVAKFPREKFYLASYIHEPPRGFAPTSHYKLSRLNRKLLGLLGDILLYELVPEYHDLFSSIIEMFRGSHVASLDAVTGESDDATRVLRFLLQSPVMAYRLDELKTGEHDKEDRAWAVGARRAIRRIGQEDAELRPSTMLDNPLLVWGGAVLAGFFSNGELPKAAAATTKAMESVPDELINPFVNQADVMHGWLAQLDPEAQAIDRLAALYDATGVFPWVVMREGRHVPVEVPRTSFFDQDPSA